MKRFFSYSVDDGIEWHDTAEEAKACAMARLSDYRKAAYLDEEWPEEVESVQWGEVTECAVAVPAGVGGEVNYELEPLSIQAVSSAPNAAVTRRQES